jgi:hypothetical protein
MKFKSDWGVRQAVVLWKIALEKIAFKGQKEREAS